MHTSMQNSGGATGGAYDSTGWERKHGVKRTGMKANDRVNDVRDGSRVRQCSNPEPEPTETAMKYDTLARTREQSVGERSGQRNDCSMCPVDAIHAHIDAEQWRCMRRNTSMYCITSGALGKVPGRRTSGTRGQQTRGGSFPASRTRYTV